MHDIENYICTCIGSTVCTYVHTYTYTFNSIINKKMSSPSIPAPVKSEIEWTPLEYRFVRNVAEETSVLVQKCSRSKEFASMFYRHHQNDLRARIQDLTKFMHRAGKEKRSERVLISKQILHLRKLMSTLQKENAMRMHDQKKKNIVLEPSYSAPPPPPGVPLQQQEKLQQSEKNTYALTSNNRSHEKTNVNHDKQEAQHKSNALTVVMENNDGEEGATSHSNDKDSGGKALRSGPQKRMKPHERLFRQRTKSMIIAENIEKRWGNHGKLKSPDANDKAKRNFETSLRGGRNSVLADEWRNNHKSSRSPKKDHGNKKPVWNCGKSVNKNVRKPSVEPTEALYAWESRYVDGSSSKQEEPKHASERIDQLRQEANDPKFKMKKHNVAFGSKPTVKGAPRFDPKSLHKRTSYISRSNNTALNSGAARVLLDFAIVLNAQEFETYRMLALGVPLEKSALQRQAVKEAAKHATKRLSLSNVPANNDRVN
jgi:hypothetical protein